MNLNQVTVSVTDVERSIAFYQTLGLHLIVKSLPHYARFECTTGDTTFSLHQIHEQQSANNTWLYFEVDNVDETIQKLAEKGIPIVEMPNDKPWLWREARINDLDNNVLIIYHAGNNRKNPPWRIK